MSNMPSPREKAVSHTKNTWEDMFRIYFICFGYYLSSIESFLNSLKRHYVSVDGSSFAFIGLSSVAAPRILLRLQVKAGDTYTVGSDTPRGIVFLLPEDETLRF
jgi:hypothetical protein